jgi:hypothetical protein
MLRSSISIFRFFGFRQRSYFAVPVMDAQLELCFDKNILCLRTTPRDVESLSRSLNPHPRHHPSHAPSHPIIALPTRIKGLLRKLSTQWLP